METTMKTARVVTEIRADPGKVWEALTTPAIVKRYFFGVDVVTDWKVGGPLLYRGEWNGKAFEDKGVIRAFEPGRLLALDYWSGFSGKPDMPENYQRVTYALEPAGAGTRLTITQACEPTAEARAHCESNWMMVTGGLKQLLEA
jgi:uncharacterized protein YndB with AHSA1/START domain